MEPDGVPEEAQRENGAPVEDGEASQPPEDG